MRSATAGWLMRPVAITGTRTTDLMEAARLLNRPGEKLISGTVRDSVV
jgi:hypothetical protein